MIMSRWWLILLSRWWFIFMTQVAWQDLVNWRESYLILPQTPQPTAYGELTAYADRARKVSQDIHWLIVEQKRTQSCFASINHSDGEKLLNILFRKDCLNQVYNICLQFRSLTSPPCLIQIVLSDRLFKRFFPPYEWLKLGKQDWLKHPKSITICQVNRQFWNFFI